MSFQSLQISAVLFDFDGTLTRPGAINFKVLKAAIHCPDEKPVLEYIEGLSDDNLKRQAMQKLESFENHAALASRPNFYAEELICFLCSEKIPVGILSRNSLRSIRIALDNFSLVSMADFNVIVSRDDPVLPKPSAEGVLLAAEVMNTSSAKMAVVGDYVFDMMAGRSAGAITIFLNNRTNSDTQRVESDYEISHLGEIIDAIRMK